ncbi:WecB/TagA/CpsF family glycosyltransferase [Alteromonas sp. ASW11-36]|uniref:WecB/TagA/CpsF family glycosyltransferase n=1 Tax=Alteromonas arenosi TaxID=3055817 RepID=A0ABT7T179_9ALTE|nr:WecB/TagA/CpsF family glycosyltransferase [Alteromonas sp. ASW11-36]MDM7861979.1 WecB/TagA/CpsF family glycosyltransferase [Alteromonas sp. ASW11-36]
MKTFYLNDLPVLAPASVEELAQYILQLEAESTFSAVALNPEKVIMYLRENEIRNLLLSFSAAYPDGIGVSKLLSNASPKKVSRVPGYDLWETLMRLSACHDKSVYLIGARPEVLDKTRSKLIEDFSVEICGSVDGFNIDMGVLIEDLLLKKPDLICVAMGSPRQEKLIQTLIEQGVTGYFMGVGGSFDVFSGTVKRAPALWQKAGLEWAYRLLSQPSRIFRQVNLVKYLYYVLIGRIKVSLNNEKIGRNQ